MLRDLAVTPTSDVRPARSPAPAACHGEARPPALSATVRHGPGAAQQVAPAGSALFSAGDATRLTVGWARHADEVQEAQRLRYRVFADEMGARLSTPAGAPALHDIDRFDAHCEHLLVRAPAPDGSPGQVVGTYRLLPPSGARRAGGLYSDTEFDLGALDVLRPRIVELGRSCVHPEWRSGGVILLLWTAMTQFMLRERLDAMIGCASIGMHDGGETASGLWRQLSRSHMAAPRWHVVPREPLPLHTLADDFRATVPPLIKGYLRCGSKVLGPPAVDPAFNTADLPLMAHMADVPARFRKPLPGH